MSSLSTSTCSVQSMNSSSTIDHLFSEFEQMCYIQLEFNTSKLIFDFLFGSFFILSNSWLNYKVIQRFSRVSLLDSRSLLFSSFNFVAIFLMCSLIFLRTHPERFPYHDWIFLYHSFCLYIFSMCTIIYIYLFDQPIESCAESNDTISSYFIVPENVTSSTASNYFDSCLANLSPCKRDVTTSFFNLYQRKSQLLQLLEDIFSEEHLLASFPVSFDEVAISSPHLYESMSGDLSEIILINETSEYWDPDTVHRYLALHMNSQLQLGSDYMHLTEIHNILGLMAIFYPFPDLELSKSDHRTRCFSFWMSFYPSVVDTKILPYHTAFSTIIQDFISINTGATLEDSIRFRKGTPQPDTRQHRRVFQTANRTPSPQLSKFWYTMFILSVSLPTAFAKPFANEPPRESWCVYFALIFCTLVNLVDWRSLFRFLFTRATNDQAKKRIQRAVKDAKTSLNSFFDEEMQAESGPSTVISNGMRNLSNVLMAPSRFYAGCSILLAVKAEALEESPYAVFKDLCPQLSSFIEDSQLTSITPFLVMAVTGGPKQGASPRTKFIYWFSFMTGLTRSIRGDALRSVVTKRISDLFKFEQAFPNGEVCVNEFEAESCVDEDRYGSLDLSLYESPAWLQTLRSMLDTTNKATDSRLVGSARDMLAYLSIIPHLKTQSFSLDSFNAMFSMAKDNLGRNPTLRSFLGSFIQVTEFSWAAGSLGAKQAFQLLENGPEILFETSKRYHDNLVAGVKPDAAYPTTLEICRTHARVHKIILKRIQGAKGVRLASYSNMLRQVAEHIEYLQAKIDNDQSTAAPFSMLLYGDSHVGKSTAISMFNPFLHELIGARTHMKVGVINEGDAYDSNIDGDCTCILYDDAGNLNQATRETSVMSRLLRFVNVVKAPLIKADVAEKGVHFAHHEIFLCTSNDYAAGAICETVAPDSATNRFHTKLHQRVVEKYRLPNGSIDKELVAEAGLTELPGQLPAFAEWCAYKVVNETTGSSVQYITAWMDGPTTLRYLRNTVDAYTKHCKKMNERAGAQNSMTMCEHRLPVNSCHICTKTVVAEAGTETISRLAAPVVSKISGSKDRFKDAAKVALFRYVCWYLWNSPLGSCFEPLLDQELWDHVPSIVFLHIVGCFASCGPLVGVIACVLNAILVFVCYQIKLFGLEFSDETLLESSQRIMWDEAKTWGKNLAKLVFLLKTIHKSPVLFSALQMFFSNGIRAEDGAADSQDVFIDAMASVPLAETKAKLKEEPIWADRKCNIKVFAPPQTGATLEQILPMIQNSMVRLEVLYSSGRKSSVCAQFLENNIIKTPSHIWWDDNVGQSHLNANVSRKGEDGFRYPVVLQMSSSVLIPGKDTTLSLITVTSRMKSLVKFLPEVQPKNGTLAKRIKLNDEGSFELETVAVTTTDLSYRRASRRYEIKGAMDVELRNETKAGDCGSLLITYEGGITIGGTHVCGNGLVANKKKNVAGHTCLTRSEYQQALEVLRKETIFIKSAQITEVVRSFEDYPVAIDNTIHKKNFSQYLSDPMEIAGDIGKLTSSRNNVEANPMSPVIAEIFGPAPLLGIPNMNATRSLRPVAGVASAYSGYVDHAILKEALDDYAGDLASTVAEAKLKVPSLNRNCPYTLAEVCDGIEGSPYLNSIHLGNSAGAPFNTKREHLFDVSDDGVKRLKPVRAKEYAEVQASVYSGNRSGTTMKFFLKSEARPLNKLDKARSISVPNTFMHMLVVQLFGPPIHVLLAMWERFEHVLGVNPAGHSWHVATEGFVPGEGDRKAASVDYESYDATVKCEIRMAMSKLYIRIAALMGYSKAELLAMENAADEWIRPLCEMNGLLAYFLDLMPSGVYITGIGNSIDGSLLMRYSFKKTIDSLQFPHNFRHYVKARVLGDDNISRIDPAIRKYWNHEVFKNDMKEIGISVTNSDKTSTIVTQDFEQLDFLKRKTFYNHDLGHRVGVLGFDSIFKACHFFVRSRDPGEQQVSILRTVLNEIFLYGREEFVEARMKMRLALDELDLPLDILGEEYDDRVVAHKRCNVTSPSGVNDVFVPPNMQFNAESTIQEDTDVPSGTVEQGITQRTEDVDEVAGGSPTIMKITEYPIDETTNLAPWFSREINIGEQSLPLGTNANITFTPVERYMNNDSIAPKWRHTAMGTFDVSLRFQVVASSGHYGAICVSATPIPEQSAANCGMSLDGRSVKLRNLLATQRPHVVLVLGREAEAVLTLPMISPTPLIEFRSTTWSKLWRLEIFNLTTLSHILPEATDPVMLRIFAHLENVHMTGATRMAESNDMGEGEAVATAMANFSSQAASVLTGAGMPSYALPMELVSKLSKGAAGVARANGWSRPISTKSTGTTPSMTGPLSQTNTDIYSKKLAADSLQAVAVSPDILGYGTGDPLHSSNFLGKYEVIDVVNWSSSSPRGTVLKTMGVTPNMLLQDVVEPGQFGIPSFAIFGLMHKYWVGSVTYKFTVCSHAGYGGVLAISHEPFSTLAGWDTSTQKTVRYAIRDRHELELTVHWSKSYPAGICHIAGLTSDANERYSTVNGYIGLTVDAPLVGMQPRTNAYSVDVIVSMKANLDCKWYDYSPGNLSGMSLVRPGEPREYAISNSPSPFTGPILGVEDSSTTVYNPPESIPSVGITNTGPSVMLSDACCAESGTVKTETDVPKTFFPTFWPTKEPTKVPTQGPTSGPTMGPSSLPVTAVPSGRPSTTPSSVPTMRPTVSPFCGSKFVNVSPGFIAGRHAHPEWSEAATLEESLRIKLTQSVQWTTVPYYLPYDGDVLIELRGYDFENVRALNVIGGSSQLNGDTWTLTLPNAIGKPGEFQVMHLNWTIRETGCTVEGIATTIPIWMQYQVYTPRGMGLPLTTGKYLDGTTTFVAGYLPDEPVPGCVAHENNCPMRTLLVAFVDGIISLSDGSWASAPHETENFSTRMLSVPVSDSRLCGLIPGEASVKVAYIAVFRYDDSFFGFDAEANDAFTSDAEFSFGSPHDTAFVTRGYAGENCFELRGLLKIFVHNYTLKAKNTGTSVIKSIYATNKQEAKISLLELLKHAFIGHRGSMNFMYQLMGRGTIIAARGPNINDPRLDYVLEGGFETTDYSVNPTLTVTVPYSSNLRYSSLEAEREGTTEFQAPCNYLHVAGTEQGSDTIFCREFHSIGEDFTLCYYIGMPLIRKGAI